MKHFFELTFRPFFVLAGAITACAWAYAFWPRWATETVSRLPFVQEDTVSIQHWGMMVGLMGAFMIMAAFRTEGRTPILVFSAIEKAFMVWLVVSNRGHSYADGYHWGAVIDGTIALYTILYFLVCRGATRSAGSGPSARAA